MRILAVILFFIHGSIYSQSFQEKFEELICSCLTESNISFEDAVNENLVLNCFSVSFDQLKKVWEVEFNDNVDTNLAYQIGMSFGMKMTNEMQSGLIGKCDYYYGLMSFTKDLMYQSFSKGVTVEKRDSVSLLITENPYQIQLLIESATYNLGLKEIDLAQKDINEYISINPNSSMAHFLLAFIFDLKDDSENALLFYDKVLNSDENIGSFKDLALIYHLILQRKSKE